MYNLLRHCIVLRCVALAGSGKGYLKSSYEGEKCIEVAYIAVSAEWVSSRTAGYLIWTEAPQLLACGTRASQERFHFSLKSTVYFCVHMYEGSSESFRTYFFKLFLLRTSKANYVTFLYSHSAFRCIFPSVLPTF